MELSECILSAYWKSTQPITPSHLPSVSNPPEDEDSQDSNAEDDQEVGGGGDDDEDDNKGDAVQGANNHESGGGDDNVMPGQSHTRDGDDTADLRRDIQPEATGSKQIAFEDDVDMLDGTTATHK
jgi:hypothetical protein